MKKDIIGCKSYVLLNFFDFFNNLPWNEVSCNIEWFESDLSLCKQGHGVRLSIQ